jgi:arylsulfatase
LDIPKDRVIDGLDQRAFIEGKQKTSSREGFLYWMGDVCYGVKWQNFKMVLVEQKTLSDPALRLATPHLVNLDVDLKERKPYDFPFIHSWVLAHTEKLLVEFKESVMREPLIPVGAPLDYVPKKP